MAGAEKIAKISNLVIFYIVPIYSFKNNENLQNLEIKLAELFLEDKLRRGSTVTVGADGAMSVE